MNKELIKMLKNLNEVLGDFIKSDTSKIDDVEKALKQAHEQKALISIQNKENGESKVHIEGSALAILINLASLEKSLLKKFDVSNDVWEMIKYTTDYKEVEEDE